MANWFIALTVDAPWWFENLEFPEGARKFHPEDLHCTIAFLGSINLHQVEAAQTLLRSMREPSIECQFSSLMCLPSEKNFRALAVGLHDQQNLTSSIIRRYRDEFHRAVGQQAETREVLAHVTLARPSRSCTRDQQSTIIHWMKQQHIPSTSLVLNSCALYTWADDRRERQFRIVEQIALAS